MGKSPEVLNFNRLFLKPNRSSANHWFFSNIGPCTSMDNHMQVGNPGGWTSALGHLMFNMVGSQGRCYVELKACSLSVLKLEGIREQFLVRWLCPSFREFRWQRCITLCCTLLYSWYVCVICESTGWCGSGCCCISCHYSTRSGEETPCSPNPSPQWAHGFRK